jgi:hypothetical protein
MSLALSVDVDSGKERVLRMPLKNGSDGRNEGKLHAWLRGRSNGNVGGSGEEFREVPSRLAFVNMVRERVWTNSASEALGRHFGQR